MIRGSEFIYDGKAGISENLRILSVDGGAIDFTTGTPTREPVLYKGNDSSTWEICGEKIERPLEFDIEFLCINDEEEEYEKRNPYIEDNRVPIINHWLFNQVKFKKFQIKTDELRDCYFMSVFTNPTPLRDGGRIIGWKCHCICNCTGCYEEKKITRVIDGSDDFQINILNDGIWEVSPTYEILVNDSYVTIDIRDDRDTSTSNALVLDNAQRESTITIDTQKLAATSSVGQELYRSGVFNKKFPKLKWGKNYIIVYGFCTITIKYSVIKEVGY